MTHEPFDLEEASRLILGTKAIEDEFTNLSEWGRKIDAEIRDGRLAGDREAEDRAFAESQRLAALCDRRAALWGAMAVGLDARDLATLRASAEAIQQCAHDAFRRAWGAERGDAE